MITCASVNKELKEQGFQERLTKGNGYFYFCGGDSANWKESGVYGVRSVNDLTMDQWLEEYINLKEA